MQEERNASAVYVKTELLYFHQDLIKQETLIKKVEL